jgi:hypothetical protein
MGISAANPMRSGEFTFSHSNPRAFSIPRIFDIEFRNRMNSALYVYFRRWPTPAIFRSQTHELATETDTKIVNC